GLLLAADTEETYGNVAKLEATKIKVISQPSGHKQMLVTGAGTGFYIDAVIQHLERHLVANDEAWTNEPARCIRDALGQFYREQVLPFTGYGEARPDFELIIGYWDGRTSRLFQTYLNTVLEQKYAAAVGAGNITAISMFNRFGPESELGPDDPFTLRE